MHLKVTLAQREKIKQTETINAFKVFKKALLIC